MCFIFLYNVFHNNENCICTPVHQTTLNKQSYRNKPASIGWPNDFPAAGQAWENEFLAARSKDKLDSLYFPHVISILLFSVY
jgi:hypothetical protein